MMGYPRIGRVIVVASLAFAAAATVPSPLPAQQAQPSATDTPATTGPQPPGNEPRPDQPPATLNAATAVEWERRFNELRRELLDDRADTVNWWLNTVLFVLGFMALVIPLAAGLAGYLSLRNFRTEAQRIVEEIKAELDKAKSQRSRLDELIAVYSTDPPREAAEDLVSSANADPPIEATEDLESVQVSSADSPTSRDVTDAIALERQGKIREAIEKWRAIANMAERTDNDLAARAWFSVGYLLRAGGRKDAGDQ